MIVEISAVVTAIATASSAIYAIRKQMYDTIKNAPATRITGIVSDGDLTFVSLTIFPTNHHVLIRRISAPGCSIAVATYERSEWGGTQDFGLAHDPSDFIDVDVDLLPASLSSTSTELTLALRLRKTQSSFQICFHRDRSFFSAKHKITAMVSKETD